MTEQTSPNPTARPIPSGAPATTPNGNGGAGSQSRKRSVVSIKDVASAANVSIATVSRVLNNPSLVAPSTAERVQAAVKELGYRPNLFAKGLMTRRSRVLGVSLPDWQGDSYSDLMRGADARASEMGYHLLVSSNAHRITREPGPGTFALDLVDGLVAMVTSTTEHDAEQLSDLDVPVVMLASSVDNATSDTIELDNTAGAAEAARHLLDGTAPDRCYFVGGPQGNLDSDQRKTGFTTTLEAAGHTVRDDQTNRGTYSFLWGWEWAGSAHERGDLKGAAVFAGNDEIALGIIKRAHHEGLDVPGDVRVVGYDDTRICALIDPPMSSVRVPNRRVGAEAVNLLVRRLDGPDLPPLNVSLKTTLVIRESSQY